MASFTDNIPQFNQYVQQLPVEAMVSVGMEKQRRYDEGLQKIQGQIQQVAGLNVLRPVDKDYLTSKLNELGGNLQTFAAADFSNFQLTNSVGGMVNQISKDPFVLAAVKSTAVDRKNMEEIENDKKAGKLTPDNEFNYNKQRRKYFESGLKDESGNPVSFSGSYIPHFDIMKYAKEQFDAIKPGKFSFDQVYETDSEGNVKFDVVRDNSGKIIKQVPVVSPYMVRMEQEGRLPEEVKSTLAQIFSDPRVKQQLQITGEYNYSGMDSRSLAELIKTEKTEKLTSYNDKIAELTFKKTMEPTEEGKSKIQQLIDKIQTGIGEVSSTYDNMFTKAYTDPDSVRGYLYKELSMDSLEGTYGSVRKSKKIESNPLWEANFKQFQEANKIKEAQADNAYKWASLQEQSRQKQLDRDNALLIASMKGVKKPGNNANETGTEFDENPSTVDIIGTFEQNKAVAANDMLQTGNTLVWESFFANNPNNINALNKQISLGKTREEGIETILKNTADKNKESFSNFITRWVNKIEVDKNKNPQNLPPILNDTYTAFVEKQKRFNMISEEEKNVDLQVSKELGINFNDITKNINIKDTPMKFQGKDVTVTKQDYLDLALYAKGNITVFGYADDKIHKENAKSAEERLRMRGKDFLIPTVLDKFATNIMTPSGVARGIKSVVREGWEALPYTDDVYLKDKEGRSIFGKMNNEFGQNLQSVYNAINKAGSEQALSRKAELLKESTFYKPNLKMAVLTGDGETDKQTLNNVRRWVLNYGRSEKNLASSSDLNGMLDVIKGDLSDISLEARVETGVGGNKVVRLLGADLKSDKSGSIIISNDEAMGLGINVSGLYEADDVTYARRIMQKTALGATSKLDPSSVSTYMQGDSYLKKFNFPRLKGNSNYDMQANLQYSNGLYYPYIYVASTDGREKRIVKQLDGLENLEAVMNKLKLLGPEFAQAALK
jgi:hypothetical protein